MLLDAEFPAKLQDITKPCRYKVFYGGRGGAKSWGVARWLLLEGFAKRLTILCAREFQNSIGDSVHRLLSEQIDAMGLGDFYEIQRTVIRGRNGTEFLFEGLRHNVSKIKSYEGVDRCWVEEAQVVSRASWDTLIPTIRKDGSEIIITFNPELEEDETYQRFVAHPPTDALVRKVNWSDNPWFPAVLRREMEDLREKDPDAYLNVWEGHCRHTLTGAIYARELREATEENRICSVPYDRAKPVDTFWDLGRADATSIWFAQIVGFEFRIIDFYQANQHALPHYLKVLQERPYVYGTHWLPHDAQNKQLHHPLSIEGQMREAGNRVRIVPKLSLADGINAARSIFPNAWFDGEKCVDGINALRRYRYDVNERGQFSATPLHDENSHAADAWRYLAVALREPKKAAPAPKVVARGRPAMAGTGWMAR